MRVRCHAASLGEGSEFVRAVRCVSPVLSSHRDRKGESRAEAQSVALGPYAAPVRFHYPLANGKAQTLSSDIRLSVRVIDPHELPEQLRQFLGGHSSTLVGDGDRDAGVLLQSGHHDRGRRGRVLGGVGQEVGQDLDHALPVRRDWGEVRRQVDFYAVPCPAVQEGGHCLVDQRRQIGGLGSDRKRPRLDPRHIEKVVDKAAHMVGLFVDDPEELVRLGGI